MNYDIDGGKVLYALGVLFALGALTYFIRDVVFGLSITVKSVLLLLAFVGFLVAGVTTDRDALDVVAFALSALAYAVFLGYVVSRYTPDETGVFLLLAASAALFVALGYVVRQGMVSPDRRTAGYAAVALLAVGLVFVGADVAGDDVTYTAELDEESVASIDADAQDRDAIQTRLTVGTLTVANPSLFTRPVTLPEAHGCVVGTDAVVEDEAPVRYDPNEYTSSAVITGGAERTHDVTTRLILSTDGPSELTLDVEHGDDCDVSREEPTLIVTFGDDVRVA
ncbi:hypothetical protein JCM17823_05960 [Halorubrum gandharaense]